MQLPIDASRLDRLEIWEVGHRRLSEVLGDLRRARSSRSQARNARDGCVRTRLARQLPQPCAERP
jgi:hypothetical protein